MFSCRLDTGILDSAVKNGDFKKLEVYILWAWLKSDNHEGSPYEQYYNIEKDEYDRAIVQNCYDKLIGPMFGKYYQLMLVEDLDHSIDYDAALSNANERCLSSYDNKPISELCGAHGFRLDSSTI